MNYIREMNAFFDWLETNPLESSTQTLWFHLMAVANKSGWPEWFAVTNPLLQAKVGVTENTLSKHRNYLVQKGRIEYKSQGKQQAGKYRLIPFTSNNEVNHEAKGEVNHEAKGEVKGSALFKLKEPKQNSSSDDPGIVDLNLKKAFRAVEAQFPARINSLQSEALTEYISKGMDPEIVRRSVEITRMAGKDILYFWGILKNCDEAGVYTIKAFEESQSRYDSKPAVRNAKSDRAAYFAQKAREAELEES